MNSRRNFIKKTTIAGAGMTLTSNMTFGLTTTKSKRKVNVGLIGVGLRGTNHLVNLLKRDDVNIVGICDIDPSRIAIALKKIEEANHKKPRIFNEGDYDYRKLLELEEIEAVVISTPWLWHTRMAKDTMLAGKYTGLEVSAANTLEECWDLVNIHEQTGSHLMILENVNYRRDVLAVLNMVKQNVFGELAHFRCGYQHDLRAVKFNNGKKPYGGGVEFGEKGMSEAKWRTQHSLLRNADVYPTHGLGPIAAMADINRGNRFVSLTSHASKPIGLHHYIVNHPQGGKNHPNAALKWKQGDVITTTIETARGETIIVTHDCNLPRPYSLGFRVQGVQGISEFDYHTRRIHVEGTTEGHGWEDMKKWLEKYDHPLWKKYGSSATEAGHGGIDFYVMNAFIESVKENIAPPMDAYDAAAWSAVTPLSELSIENNGEPQDFPDFTRGNWIKREPYDWIKDTY
ncbi:Gfo/Idh/MocA family protein [Aquimarina sp. 2201CG5-10]|uniref:Gfo/Idh/MocA family protein n=1 Tax=Aquimarina callyspongiae TaxID=3098150 RepID=UPI002AB5DDBC|nr:Gfo/Idh/MocA family oxidoreductase [Aquimarina sp. 2201CG5-10]MDY8134175.1 Gfo/Idh/MocA family oxidoreductase [Aquimarina sp. 2201CG5-10]